MLQLLTDTAATMKNVRFQSLDVTRNERGATENEWFISFRATYEPALGQGKKTSKFLIEKSRFLKNGDGKWKFMSSLTISAPLGTHGTAVVPPAAHALEPPAAA